jgi:hypothetical protein
LIRVKDFGRRQSYQSAMHGARFKTYPAATVCALILLGADPTDAVAVNIGFSVALAPPPPVVKAPPPPPSAAGEVRQ